MDTPTIKESGLGIVRVHLPLKQGLRHRVIYFLAAIVWYVRVHLPLKQGLRRFCTIKLHLTNRGVRVHLPLKQGLRPSEVLFFLNLSTSTSASSIKTRIKTL